jgi:phosphatidylserine decarboxylase
MRKPVAILLQYIMPKLALTALAGKLASAKLGIVTHAFIRWFVGKYQVNMQEALHSDIHHYASFNEFFTRPLRPDVRSQAKALLTCPVDGRISQLGRLQHDQIVQAKGHHYSLSALLAGDKALCAQFIDGDFATIYLSPKDYHRIHMPCAGTLVSMTYVPGDLFSVNPLTAEHVPGLFARNERVICEFSGKQGHFVMVLVGATIVGSMATVWHGVVNPPRKGKVIRWDYHAADEKRAIHLQQGEEMGRFLLGSTVVLLFPQRQYQFHPDWQAGKPVRLGEAMSA